MSIRAILFDVDGTLINSEPLSQLSVCQMYAEYGVKVTSEDIIPMCGQSDQLIFSTLNERFGLKADVDAQSRRRGQLYEQQASEKLEFVNGAADFVRSCRNAGLRIAVATGATRNHLGANLKALGLSFDDFMMIVCGGEVEHSKPAPDIYLKAAQGVDIDPHECLVFEDSDNGHRSARAAGCMSIGILTTFAESTQRSCGAAKVMNDFTQFPSFHDVESFNDALENFLKD